VLHRKDEKMSGTNDKTIWYTRCPVGNATEVALSLGWLSDEFRDLGYGFQSISTSGPEDWSSHFDHTHPAMFRDGGNIPPIWARSNGADTKAIGLNFLNEAHALVVKPGANIWEVADLKGKRLGIPERPHEPIDFWRATTKRAFEAALNANGLELDDVTLVPLLNKRAYVEPSDANGSLFAPGPGRQFQSTELEALSSGRVDAIYLSGGRAAEAERSSQGRIVIDLTKTLSLLDRANIQLPNLITVSGRLADEHPELVVAYLKVLVRAASWARDHRAEVLRLFADATFVEPRDFETAWSGDFYWTLEPHLSAAGRQALEIEKGFLLKEGFIARDFDVDEWVDPSYLEQAHAESAEALSVR
jgi:sulfonate transport system substrate-binding protein